jgi:hypothetical protein
MMTARFTVLWSSSPERDGAPPDWRATESQRKGAPSATTLLPTAL